MDPHGPRIKLLFQSLAVQPCGSFLTTLSLWCFILELRFLHPRCKSCTTEWVMVCQFLARRNSYLNDTLLVPPGSWPSRCIFFLPASIAGALGVFSGGGVDGREPLGLRWTSRGSGDLGAAQSGEQGLRTQQILQNPRDPCCLIIVTWVSSSSQQLPIAGCKAPLGPGLPVSMVTLSCYAPSNQAHTMGFLEALTSFQLPQGQMADGCHADQAPGLH